MAFGFVHQKNFKNTAYNTLSLTSPSFSPVLILTVSPTQLIKFNLLCKKIKV